MQNCFLSIVCWVGVVGVVGVNGAGGVLCCFGVVLVVLLLLIFNFMLCFGVSVNTFAVHIHCNRSMNWYLKRLQAHPISTNVLSGGLVCCT